MTRSTAEPCQPAGLVAWPAWVVAFGLLGGCASNAPAPTAQAELGRSIAGADARLPSPLEPFVNADRAEGARNVVLNAMHAGKLALDIGALAPSRRALDLAYQRIEVIYADNPAAAQARSKFAPESNKDFKGEPYERAMVGYYLGLADLLMGDLDNAKASFKWGEYQDTMSASEVYQGDMASMRYLAGWVEHCRQRQTAAREDFKLAQDLKPGLGAPAGKDNLLLILEAGSAPRKARAGRYGEELVYAKQADLPSDATAEFTLDGGTLQAVLAEDIYWQATTLGGRAVDRILAGKAAFKENATTVSNVGAGVAQVGLEVMRLGALSGDNRALNLGGLGAAAGLLTSLVGSAAASATKPEADIRQWSSLPGAIFMRSTTFSPAPGVDARVRGRAPASLGSATGSAIAVAIPGTACYLARVATGSDAPAWSANSPGAWLALDDITAAPAKPTAQSSKGDPDGPRPAPVKTAPVRATF